MPGPDAPTVKAAPGRLVELEALRGIAATVVLLHHFLLLVAPRLHGRNFDEATIYRVARAWERATHMDKKRPPI